MHTPGPWTITAATQYDDWKLGYQGNHHAMGRFIVGPDGHVVGTAVMSFQGFHVPQEPYDNARLIASAPELLDLLQRLRQWDMLDATEDGQFWKGEMDKAISKATGAT